MLEYAGVVTQLPPPTLSPVMGSSLSFSWHVILTQKHAEGVLPTFILANIFSWVPPEELPEPKICIHVVSLKVDLRKHV